MFVMFYLTHDQLRVQSNLPVAELISYNRGDIAGPKLSTYQIAHIQVCNRYNGWNAVHCLCWYKLHGQY